MAALRNLGVRIELAQFRFEFRRTFRRAFRDKNETRPFDVSRWLTQEAARQNAVITKWIGVVHEYNIHSLMNFQILKPVVEHQCVATQLANGIFSRFHAVFIHQHGDIGQVGRQHIGFVPGQIGIEQQTLAIGHHARKPFLFFKNLLPEWRFSAFVPSAQNGDLAPLPG